MLTKSLLPTEELLRMSSLTPLAIRRQISISLRSHIQHPIFLQSLRTPSIAHVSALHYNHKRRYSSQCTELKHSSPIPTSFTRTSTGYTRCLIQRQQWRCWYESAKNPVHFAREEEERRKAEAEKNDVVGKRMREIEETPGDTQTIWASVFLDGKLVNGTQITIPKYNANIDLIKYAVKDKCPEILTDIAAITFQVLPTRYKRKKSRRKLTRKNRILKADVLYDMARHGGESEISGIIVKAHTRKMQEGNHFTYGTYLCNDLCSYCIYSL